MSSANKPMECPGEIDDARVICYTRIDERHEHTVRVEDDDEGTYGVTIKWFVWSVVGMLIAVCLATVVLSEALAPQCP